MPEYTEYEKEPVRTFEALDAGKPKPITRPTAGSAWYLFAAARTCDANGDTAGRSYWLDQFTARLEDGAS